MVDFIFHSTVNNVCLSLALALIAATIGLTLKRPVIAHLLWILVLLKLLTPPLVTISALPMPALTETEIEVKPETIEPLGLANAFTSHAIEPAEAAHVPAVDTFKAAVRGRQWLLLAWLFGSGIVFSWSLFQVLRFHRLLLEKTEPANPEIRSQAAAVATSLGLRSVPAIHTTAANISPMVWWTGGKIRIVLPDSLIRQMDSRPLEWILAHELAHVRRRDYLVRWIEWMVCVCFWWNPVTWWARSNLRANEELCCDALVLSAFKPEPVQYGASLLQAVEILAGPSHRAPVIASGIDGGKLLKNRMRMIVTGRLPGSNLRWLQAGILLGALVVLPLGLICAKEKLEGLLMAAQTRGENQAIVYGSNWRLSAQVPRGWIGDTFNAGKMQANILIYGDRYTIDSAPALVKIWIGDKDDEDTERNLQYDLEQLKRRFPNVRSTYITVFHNGYVRDSRLFYIPDGFYEYVTYLNPGKGYPWSVSVVMNKREGEATEAELDAYRKIIQSVSLSYQLTGYASDQLTACFDDVTICGIEDSPEGKLKIAAELMARIPEMPTEKLLACFDNPDICGGESAVNGWQVSAELAKRGNLEALLARYWTESKPKIRAGIEHVAYRFDTPEVTAFMKRILTEQPDDGENLSYPVDYLARKCDPAALQELTTGNYKDPWMIPRETDRGFNLLDFGGCRYRPAIPYLVDRAIYDANLNRLGAAAESLHALYPDSPERFDSGEAMQRYFCGRARQEGFDVRCFSSSQ